MSRLLRATNLVGLPVVTLGGESPLEVKDIVFDRASGDVLGFTLRKHGFLGSPVDEELAWADVHGLGPDAVTIEDDGVLDSSHDLTASGGDVLGARVLTEGGTDLGEVVEVVVRTGTDADVMGFEIEATEHLGSDDGHHVFLPLPDTVAISEERIIVPDSATDYVRHDLAGFGGAVEDFRAQLEEVAS